MIFHAKIGVWGRIYIHVTLYSYLIKREIILYLEKNYTLFGNLAIATLTSHTHVIYMLFTLYSLPIVRQISLLKKTSHLYCQQY